MQTRCRVGVFIIFFRVGWFCSATSSSSSSSSSRGRLVLLELVVLFVFFETVLKQLSSSSESSSSESSSESSPSSSSGSDPLLQNLRRQIVEIVGIRVDILKHVSRRVLILTTLFLPIFILLILVNLRGASSHTVDNHSTGNKYSFEMFKNSCDAV